LNWLEISLTVDGELAEAVADLLARYAPGGVAIESKREAEEAAKPEKQVVVCAYLPADEQLEARQAEVEAGLWHLGMIRPLPTPVYRTFGDADWAEAWREHYRPIRIGRRLLVLPAWLPSPDESLLAIVLDPGMAFGTGIHPSTQLCLAALEDFLRTGDEVIDLGCGSGILSIAAVRLGARCVRALDTDPLAVRVTVENADRNGCGGQIAASTGSLDDLLEADAPSADLLVANILAPVLDEMARQGLSRAVRPGGIVILAGVLAEQAEPLEATCLEHGFDRIDVRQSGDWHTLVLKSKPPHSAEGGCRTSV
jgi:ribosomal protein L11 methyltransferase